MTASPVRRWLLFALIVTAGVLNYVDRQIIAVLKPLIKVVGCAFYILTLGLITFVVNALMLELTSWLSQHTDLQLHIDHFWWQAVGAAVVVTFVSLILNLLLPDKLRDSDKH